MDTAYQSIQEDLVSFQMFRSAEDANEIGAILMKAGIGCRVQQQKQFFDPSFAFNKTEPDISLNLRQEDFSKAREVLQEYYEKQLDTVDHDYYLFQFTDQELTEIIRKPDEWGSFDYELAKRILRNRGIEITPDLEQSIRQSRISELSKPESGSPFWVLAGYIAAILGGFLGLLIGWLLANLTKTLPNGERVAVYNERVRKHGKMIFSISVFSFIVFMAFRLWMQYE